MRFAIVMAIAMIGLLAASSGGKAQPQSIKNCHKEWRADKAANLARGITERAYLDQCRAGGTSAAHATFVASPDVRSAASAPSSPLPAATPAALSSRPANKILCE